MTEAAAVFNEQVRERSIIKKSAAHKKNGSAVPKLGNKPMSWQEIRAKHGDVKRWNLNNFMNLVEFSSMPSDMQVEYVNKLCDKYDIGIKHLSKELFEMDDTGLRDYLSTKGILMQCNPQKPRMKYGLELFKYDVADWKRKEKIIGIIDEQEKEDQFSDFMTYDEYQTLLVSERLAYVNFLIEKYGVSSNTIAKRLFGKSSSTLENYFKSKGVSDQISKPKYPKNSPGASERNKAFENTVEEWRKLLGNITKEPEEVNIVTSVFDVIPEEPKEEEKVISIPIEDLDATAEEVVEKSEEKPKWSSFPDEEAIASISNVIKFLSTPSGFDPSSATKQEPKDDPRIFHDSFFKSSYTSEKGMDEDQLAGLMAMFKNKRVHVNIEVMVVEA